MNNEINECCQNTSNLVEVERRPATNGMNISEKGILIIRKCSICTRKHYELNVDPIVIGIN